MKRNPHPARRSRIATLGISATAFVSIITSLAWNTHQAELAANITDPNAVPVETTVPASSATNPVAPATGTATTTATPAATTAPAAPAKSTKTSAPAAPAVAPTVAPATPVVPAQPATAAVAPAAPAPTVVYTCMSPGGKTENPTASGTCHH
ncbi:hypothetical protein GM51_21780 [freshwater metagenome]|uniref:Uncharacterized protein n=1 Tax=freshwater metagenome TaxID=449393 RepID=A0A094S387_9ZZZZ